MGKRKAKPRRYGSWGGNPTGTAEDKTCCIESVHDGHLFHQCSRKRGFGKDGLHCKQHDPVSVAKREKAREDKWDAKWDAQDRAARTRRKRDKLARDLAEAVIRTVPGPSRKGDPVTILLKLARQLLKLYEKDKRG